MSNLTRVFIFLTTIFTSIYCIRLDSWSYYPYHQANKDMITIRKPSATKIILKCESSSCGVSWYFQPCKADVYCPPVSLTKIINVPITRNKFCSNIYKIRKAKEKDSGIYRCEENGKVLQTFKVEIVEKFDIKLESSKPKIIDISPRQLSVSKKAHVIIKCEVQSELFPIIIWFKETNHKTNDTVEYLDKYYKKITTSQNNLYPIPNKIDVYMSKLNIQDMVGSDSGLYVCLALSDAGGDFETVTIVVEEPLSHYFLFLIPVGLILIMLLFGLYYYWKKTRKPAEIPANTTLNRPFLNNVGDTR